MAPGWRRKLGCLIFGGFPLHFLLFLQKECGPQKRMLTLMLMVQMSKHVKMQSHKTLVQNKLIISTDSGVLSGEDSAQGVQWGLWSVK